MLQESVTDCVTLHTTSGSVFTRMASSGTTVFRPESSCFQQLDENGAGRASLCDHPGAAGAWIYSGTSSGTTGLPISRRMDSRFSRMSAPIDSQRR